MIQLHGSIFTSQSPESIEEELSWRKQILIVLAFDDEKVVGYKIGYEDRHNKFYSRLGGVYPEYREKGIATTLLKSSMNGFKRIVMLSYERKRKTDGVT